MYKFKKPRKSSLKSVKNVQGEPIEHKVKRIVENGESIKDGAPELYPDRSEGVLQGSNVRTDRWEVAVDAMDAVSRSVKAKRDYKPKMEVVKEEEKVEIDNVVESTQGKAQE